MVDHIAEPAPLAKSKRRWLSFRLRTLPLLLTVGCIWLGWYANSAQRQRRAVAAIEKLGGSVRYDYQPTYEDPNPSIPPPGPEWLVKLVGRDYLNSVVCVHCYHDVDAIADQVTNLPHFTSFYGAAKFGEFGEPIAQAAFARFKSRPNMRTLIVIGNNLDDDSLAQISGLTHLEGLQISHGKITDEGLTHLSGMQSLTYLNLDGCQITDAGLRHLKNLASLKRISLCRTQVTRTGVRKLNVASASLTINGVNDVLKPSTPGYR